MTLRHQSRVGTAAAADHGDQAIHCGDDDDDGRMNSDMHLPCIYCQRIPHAVRTGLRYSRHAEILRHDQMMIRAYGVTWSVWHGLTLDLRLDGSCLVRQYYCSQ